MSAEAFGDFSSMCLKCLSAIIDTPKEAKYRRIRIGMVLFSYLL